MFLEAVFLVEAIAPPDYHIDRFLPVLPLRVVVDALGNDVTVDFSSGFSELETGSVFPLLDSPRIKNKIFPSMLSKCRQFANAKGAGIAAAAALKMRTATDLELSRLKELQAMNSAVRPEEIPLLEERQQALAACLQKPSIRLDSLRLVWQNPEA